jgi:4-amino-4-deoxy-L-arabinose transferase-like glycosyltransferase
LRSVIDHAWLLIALAYLAAALHGLGGADIVGDDEAREAGIVQSVAAGHWLLPRFNEELLPDKPILYHWLAAVPVAVAGFSETAVRLPSALAGAALVGWTARFGTALWGPVPGLIAAGLLATTPALFSRVRVARPDVLMVLLLAIALGMAFRWWRDRRPADASAALALLGAATFAKGPVAPVLFVVTLGAFLAWQRDLRRLPRIVTAPGAAAFLVLGLGWYVVALAGWGDTFVREHLLGRYLYNLAGGLPAGGAWSTRSLTHHLFYYPVHLLGVALPWTPLAAFALWRAWRSGGIADPRDRFLLCWMLAPVIVFTPAQYKLRYYLLPSLPALALLSAPAVLALRFGRPRLDRTTVTLVVGTAVVGAALLAWAFAGAPGLSRSDRATFAAVLPALPGGAATAAAAAAFLVGVLLVVVALRAWPALVAVVAAGTAAWMVFAMPAVARLVSERDSLKAFARDVAEHYPKPGSLVFYPEPIRSVAVYLGRPVPTVGRDALTPGLAVVTTDDSHRALLQAGVLGVPVLVARGRVGNVKRGWAICAEVLAPQPSRPSTSARR